MHVDFPVINSEGGFSYATENPALHHGEFQKGTTHPPNLPEVFCFPAHLINFISDGLPGNQ